MKRLSIFVCVVLFNFVAAADVPVQPGIVSSEFIFETAPFPSCHASTIVETKSGLVSAWFGGAHEGAPDVGIWVSRHVEGKWSAPVEVADGIQVDGKPRLPCWNPVLFQPSKGPLLLFYKIGPNPEKWWGMLRTSTDDGKTWSDAKRLPDGILGPIKNKPVELKNGDIICPSSTEVSRNWRAHFELSSDVGSTWKKIEPAPDTAGKGGAPINAIQPSVLIRVDGSLLSIGRTREGKVFQTTSTDQGKSWGSLTLTQLPNPNSGTDAATLKDGSHVLIYNHTGKGRSPLNIAVSKDGKEWSAALVLENDAFEYSYPCIIQTNDGLVHAAYTWHRTKIKHVVMDPAKLEVKPIVGMEWPK